MRGLVVVRSRLGVRKKGEQPSGGLAGLAGGAHDRAVIFAQHLEPRADVVRVADRRDDAERSAAEGRVHLGYEFLERVLLRAESAGQLPVQPAVVAARSEEHTSETQSLIRISYAVVCLKTNKY